MQNGTIFIFKNNNNIIRIIWNIIFMIKVNIVKSIKI